MHRSPGKVEKSLHYLERRLDRWYQQNCWTKLLFSGLVNMVELMGAVCADKITGKVTQGPGKALVLRQERCYQCNSKGYTHVLGVARHNGTETNVAGVLQVL